MPYKKQSPVYRMLVSRLERGFAALDDQTQHEIAGFIKSQQHISGAFMDRAGFPDLYYSLFGLWLSMATRQDAALEKLRRFTVSEIVGKKGPVEELSLILINAALQPLKPPVRLRKLFALLQKEGKNISLSYRFFLMTLTVDAAGKNRRFFYWAARLVLFFYRPKGNLSAPLLAALAFARNRVGLGSGKPKTELLELANKKGGFRTFSGIGHSDMLSTGVALFALAESDSDLRMLAPANLEFVQNNYSKGAFLSGDGDETRDLEYTFYGMLALGSLL